MVTSTTSSTSSTAVVAATADSASIGSALATALGGGTGIDMTALAGNIAQAEFGAKISRIDTQSSTLDTQISQASQLKSDLLSLSSSLGTLVRTGNLAATPSVANSAVANASVPVGSSGGSGSYSLEVTTLASPQVLNSPAYTSATSAAGAGTLTLDFGTVSGTAFTPDASHAPVSITVPSGATLGDVATAINQAGAGVTAYIANSSDGAHLVLKGQTGATNAFTLTATESPTEPGLAALAWTPASGTTRLGASASNAAFKLDGIAQTATSNSIDNVAPGLSLKLTGTNAGAPTTVTFSDPASGISSAMSDLTTALNAIVTELHGDLDPASGALAQDPAARAVMRQLSQLTSTTIMPNAASGDPRTLSDLGLSVDKSGNFTLDNAKLTSVLTSRPGAVAAMFTTGLYGVFGTVDGMTRNMTSATDTAALGGTIAKYTKMKTTLADQRAKLVTQQDKVRTRLINQYASANSVVAAQKSTLLQLQSQMAAWNKTG